MGVLRVRDNEGNIKEVYSVKVASDDSKINSLVEGTVTEIDLQTATKIRQYAFMYYPALTNVNMPNVESIGSNAFANCNGLTSIDIPSSVTSIGNYAFNGCINLKKVNITDLSTWCNITFGNYQSNPIYNAKSLYINGNLATDITIPNGVTNIKWYAFYNYQGLKNVDIPNSVTTIGQSAFSNCTGLTSIDIPNSVTSIEPYAFDYCIGLTSVTIPNSVTNIAAYVFRNCAALTSVTFKGTPTTIITNAFSGCTNLTTINVPFSEGEVANAPWGATNATINYNYVESEE